MEEGINSLPPLEQEILKLFFLEGLTLMDIASRLDLREHVLLPEMKGLPKRSMVMAEQQATVALEQLMDYRGRVDWEIFKKINSAVRICEKTKREQY